MIKEETLKTQVAAFLKLVGKRRLWIQTHDVPDPDALASAEALRVIARHFGMRAQIVAKGFPHRRENKALIRECKIPLKPLESVKIQSVSRAAWAFIDCLPGGGNVTLHPHAPGNLFLAIDHHGNPGNSLKNNPGAYVITDRSAGATATMLGMLLFGLDVPFPPRLASALSYAIISDTLDFSRGASQTDLDVYAALFPFTNQKIISRLRTTTKSQMYFRTLHRALANAGFYRHVSWVWTGEVKSGEDVAEMADLILSCERITWSLALGYAGDRLYLSMNHGAL